MFDIYEMIYCTGILNINILLSLGSLIYKSVTMGANCKTFTRTSHVNGQLETGNTSQNATIVIADIF